MIPRTFRFDKYRFRPSTSTERSSPATAPRSVDSEAHTKLKRPLPHDGKSDETPDEYHTSAERLIKDTHPKTNRIRSLWQPTEDSGLFLHPLKILVGIEAPQDPHPALWGATAIAQQYHCQLLLARVLTHPTNAETYQSESTALSQLNGSIEQKLALNYRDQYPPQIQICSAANPADGLLQIAAQEHPSLIVVGSQPKSENELLRKGSILKKLLKLAPCPVLVWREREDTQSFKCILVPVDGTPFSYQAILQAILICKEFGGTVIIFYVAPETNNQTDQSKAIANLINKMEWHGVTHEFVHRSGSVVPNIVQYCQSATIDMVIMGTHSVLTEGHELKGSLSQEVVRQVSCPILIVHPDN